METGEHGPDRLYDKFRVFRAKTGEELTGRGEFIFVLRPETNDMAAVAALSCYAAACEGTYPQLVQDILAELRRFEDQVEIEMAEMGVDRAQACRNLMKDRADPPMMIPPLEPEDTPYGT